TASVIKLAVLVELFRQAAAATIDLDGRITMTADDRVLGSGILKELGGGLAPTARDLATAMVVLSDNTATNLLIDLVGGVEPVNATMRDRLGLPDITLHRRIDFGQIGSDVRRFGESTPRDLARLAAAIARGEAVDAASSAAMLDIMRRQQYLNQVPRYLNVNPHADALGETQSVWVGCKTGMTPGVRTDAGVIHLPGETDIAYCAMTEESADRAMTEEAEGEIANGLIGRALVAYWWPGGAPPGALRDSAWVDAVLA
ncbi:MAG TPA: serine hydrolase, partial [Thermomicrobiales bacterium]|nr:serine hydrolase [Thermomicrobiales bacterium]